MGLRGPRPTLTKAELIRALRRHSYMARRVAAETGISRQSVYALMQSYGIRRRLTKTQRSDMFKAWWSKRRARSAA